MGRNPLLWRDHRTEGHFPLSTKVKREYRELATLSRGCPRPKGRSITCYSPVRHFTRPPKGTFSCDLHVLGMPPAFVLSQNQTLQINLVHPVINQRLIL